MGSTLRNRYGWRLLLVAVTTIVAALVAQFVAANRPVTHTAEATLLVSSGSGDGDPGNAGEAVRLAQTMAELLPQDSRVVAAVADALGAEAAVVEGRIAAEAVADTGLVHIRYTSDEPATSRQAVSTVIESVTGDTTVTPAVSPGSLLPARQVELVADDGTRPDSALAVGALLGLLLGLALLVVWERSDPRVVTGDDLQLAAGTPATSVRDLSPAGAGALLARWAELAGSAQPTVAVLPVSAGRRRASHDAVAYLQRLAESDEPGLRGATTGLATAEPGPGDVRLEGGGAPGEHEAGQRQGLRSDLVVLLAEVGTSVKHVQAAVDELDRYGLRPAWALLESSTGPRSTGHRDERRAEGVGGDRTAGDPDASDEGVVTLDDDVVAGRPAGGATTSRSR